MADDDEEDYGSQEEEQQPSYQQPAQQPLEPSQPPVQPALQENYFDRFDAPTQRPPEQRASANYFDQFDEKPQTPEAESGPVSFIRQAAHGVLPFLASIPGAEAGAAIGGAAGTAVVPGIGTTIGAIGGGLLGAGLAAAGASVVQETGAKALGISDDQQVAANAATHPYWSMAGEVAPFAAGFGPGAIGKTAAQRLLSRGAGAALGGGLEAGQELTQGEFDPTRIAVQAGTGAVLARPRAWTEGLQAPARRFGEQIGERFGLPTQPRAAAEAAAAEQPAQPGQLALPAPETRYGEGFTMRPPSDESAAAPAGRPDLKQQPAPQTEEAIATQKEGAAASDTKGASSARPPPPDVNVSGREIGVGSRRDYAAEPREGSPEAAAAAQPTGATVGEVSPDIQVALQATQGAQQQQQIPGGVRDAIGRQYRGMPDAVLNQRLRDPDLPRVHRDVINAELSARGAPPPEVPQRQMQQAQQIQPGGEPAIGPAPSRARPAEERPIQQAQQPQPEQPVPPGLREALAKRYQGVSDEALRAAAGRPDLPPGHAEAIANETARRVAGGAQERAAPAGAAPPGATPPRGPAGPAPLGGHPPGQGPPSAGPGIAGQIAQRVPVLGKIKRTFQELFAPDTISDDARKAEAHISQYASARAGERDRIVRDSLQHEKFWDKVPEQDRTDFLHAVETGGQVKPEYQAHADRYRKMLDQAATAERELGSKAAYREDYFPHIWERPPAGKPSAAEFFNQMQSLGPTSFQKARTIDLIKQGLDAGYKLKSTNPEVLVRDRLLAGADMRQRMELLGRMRDEGLAVKVKDEANATRLSNQGWAKINAPDREQWMIAPDVQPIWKNGVAARGLWSDPSLLGDAFRGWMGFKSAWIPVRLALSAFHPLHVAHINFSQNLARAADQVMAGHFDDAFKSVGQAVTPWSKMGKEAKAQWLLGDEARTPDGKRHVQLMEEGGFNPMMSEQLRIDAERKLTAAWQAMNPIKIGYHGQRYLIQKIQKPIFEDWIPHLKTAAYLNDAAALLQRRPELLANETARKVALSAIARSVDNRFGEMFYDRLFWNRYMKDAGIGSFLSLGWNLGFVREFGGAAMEAATRPAAAAGLLKPTEMQQIARDATNKMKFAGIYMGTAALLGGLMTKMFTGENPKEANDFIFPRVGGVNPDGSPRRLTTMFYLREIPMLEKHVQEQGGGIGGTLAGARDMVYSKMMFEPFIELMRNRSYFGNEIYDSNAPAYRELMQAGQHILNQQLMPMSITGGQRAIETGGGWGEAGLAGLGFGPAPAYAERTALQNRIGALYQRFVAPEAKPYEDEADTAAKQRARAQVLMAKQSKDPERITAALKAGKEAGLTPQYMGQLGRPGFDTDQRMFKRLPQQIQMAVLNQASEQELPRYLPHASSKTKIQWRKEHPQQPQGFAEGGPVDPDASEGNWWFRYGYAQNPTDDPKDPRYGYVDPRSENVLGRRTGDENVYTQPGIRREGGA